MSICKYVKWVLVFGLSVFIFVYSRQISSKERHQPLDQRQRQACSIGGTCRTRPPKTTTTSPATKPTKGKAKKPANSKPLLEKVHILPIAQKHEPQEILSVSKGTKPLQRKLLILSYFDWGPPSIGDILSRHPDVFYFDEPLHPFDSTPQKDGGEPISRRMVTEAVEYLEDLLNCRLFDGDDRAAVKKMAKRAYKYCSSGSEGNVTECVQSSCQSSRIIVSRTIRLYVQDVKDILSRSKGLLKVVILQRDPRANLNFRSQKLKPGWISGSDMFFQGRSLCSRMLHDIHEAKRLEGAGFRDFYRIVLFEHFLKAPETVLGELFAFLGVRTDVEDVRKVLRVSGGYKQVRRALLNRWDWLPDEDACLHIDKACGFFYRNSLYSVMKTANGYLQRYNLCKYCD